MKECKKCKNVLPSTTEFFKKEKRNKDGLTGKCKECIKIDFDNWYYQNRDYQLQKRKDYYKQNKDKWIEMEKREDVKEYKKWYRENNKEYFSKKGKEWYDNNKEKSSYQSKEYRENNIEHVRKKRKEWNDSNKEHIKEYGKEYRENNRHTLELKSRNYKNSPISFHSNSNFLKEIGLYEDIKESLNGNLMCKCDYCGEWFEPLYKQVAYRVYAINGKYKSNSENRLYCSQSCKDNCPIFNQSLFPKDQKPATSREVQPQLRQLVFERDNYTCQKCNIHKDELEVGIHCHHIYPLNEDPIQSADIDTCITLCETCHKWIHQNVAGCGYGEMKCDKYIYK